MSISELLVVLVIAVLVMNPNDVINLLRNFKKFKNYLNSIKKDFFSAFEEVEDNINNVESSALVSEAKELNFYLKKIVDLEGNYEGTYSLPAIKKKYEQLMKEDITDINRPN